MRGGRLALRGISRTVSRSESLSIDINHNRRFSTGRLSAAQRHSDGAIPPLAVAPIEGQKFMAFNLATEREDGSIPRKYRELIALAVALTTQCSYCIDVHTHHAREHGVTREELAEAAFIAAAVRAGEAWLIP